MLNSNTLNSTTLNGINGITTQTNPSAISCTLKTSGYKWLTPTLLSAQQQPNVRPYFQCHIVDDKVLPNNIIAGGVYPINGASITAPDGNILAAGIDASGNLGFWKIPDASIAWSISPTVILNNNSGVTPLNTSISVSEFINGIYRVDVYNLFINVTNFVRHCYSNDGGITWSSEIISATGYIYIAAGKSYQDINGVTQSTFFANTTSIITVWNYTTGSWVSHNWTNQVDTSDWILNSIDTTYDGNYYFVVFSGHHQYFESSTNFGIYSTTLSVKDGISNNIWTSTRNILESLSSSTFNQNTFTFPTIRYDGEFYWLVYNAEIVNTITTQVSAVTTTTNYYISKSKDLINFSYPLPITLQDGYTFTDTAANSFVFQNDYYYITGNGQVWQFIKNNIIADVSSDIISVSTQEQGGNPSSISIVIGNQNGQWFGTSPTSVGYQAIAKDRKILLDLGYYNANGFPETVPRNIFYIDDIEQNVTNTANDLTITGRDYNKQLSTTVSKFTMNYIGCDYESDNFDGTTVSDWNQSVGTWIQNPDNILYPTFQNTWATAQSATPTSPGGYDTDIEYLLLYSSQLNTQPNWVFNILSVLPGSNSNSSIYQIFYPFYQDSKNWIRLQIIGNGSSSTLNYNIQVSYGGSVNTVGSGNFPFPSGGRVAPCPIIIKKSGFLFSFLISSTTSSGNDIAAYDPSSSPIYLGYHDFSDWFNGVYANFTSGTIGFGTENCAGKFSTFKLFQYNFSQNIYELTEKVATQASIFDYEVENDFADNIFTTDQYTGTFTSENRELILAPTNYVVKTDQNSKNGEIVFQAKIVPTVSNSAYGFDLLFRNQNTSDILSSYVWNSQVSGDNLITSSRIDINWEAAEYLLASSSDVDYMSSGTFNNLGIDLTQWHTYKLVMSDQYILGFIDNKLVVAWNDNNTTQTYQSGYFGFRASANSTLHIRGLTSSLLYNQVNNFSINSGDDMSSDITSALGIMRSWNYSDLMGQMNMILLQSSDPSTYTYKDEIQQQVTDNSDKEYVNEVTVYGNGVMAIAQDQSSISSTGKIRESIYQDYKILTYADALTRAQYELINANIFNNQSQPVIQLNVGAEIFDSITIINNGPNSSGVNGNLREYNQNISVGGGSTSTGYTVAMETGNL
jgi:hypothetical protein